MRPRVYLAGPDVFLPDAPAFAAARRAVCARHGLEGVSPLDGLADEPAAWAVLPEWRAIHLRNEAHIRSCAGLIANLTPFRGPSADVGTAFELGFMRALGRPVFGYSLCGVDFTARTRALAGTAGGSDAEGMVIEPFGLTDNLMLDGAIAAAGGVLVVEHRAGRTDLEVFERCVVLAARVLGAA